MTLVGIGVVLLVKRRAASIRPVPPPPMALASPFVEYELFGPAVDEWVAHAPYPDQALQAARHAPSTSLDANAHTPPRSPNPYREDIESVESSSHPSKIGNARRRAVRDPPSIAGRSLAAIRRSQDKRPRLSLVCPCLGDRRIFIVRRHASLIGGFGLETAGVLNERRRLRALAKTGQSGLLKGKGKITGYLLRATACDGTLATTAQFTSARIVCRNTLQVALGDSTSVVKALFASKAILKSPALPSRRRYLKIHPATVCETTRFFAERGVADGNVI